MICFILLPFLLASSAQAFDLAHPAKDYNGYESKPYEHNYGYGHPYNHESQGYPSYYGSYDLSHGYNGMIGYAPHVPTSYAPHGYVPSSYSPSSYSPSSYAPHGYTPSSYGPSSYAPHPYGPGSYAPHLYTPHGYGAHFYKPLNKYQKYGLPYF